MLTNISVGGVSAAVSKTAAAPIERVKLLIQNQVRRVYMIHVVFASQIVCYILAQHSERYCRNDFVEIVAPI